YYSIANRLVRIPIPFMFCIFYFKKILSVTSCVLINDEPGGHAVYAFVQIRKVLSQYSDSSLRLKSGSLLYCLFLLGNTKEVLYHGTSKTFFSRNHGTGDVVAGCGLRWHYYHRLWLDPYRRPYHCASRRH